MDDIFGVVQDAAGVIGKDHFHLGAGFPDQLSIVIHVVDAGEAVDPVAEELPVALQSQQIPVRIHALLVQTVPVHQVVAHLVRGIGEHQDHFLRALGDAPQADGKAVAAEDGEDDADGPAAQLLSHVGGDIVHRGVVALGPGHNGLSHGDDVPVMEGKALLLGGGQDGCGHDLLQIVSLTDDGGADAPGYSSYHTTHRFFTCLSFAASGIGAIVLRKMESINGNTVRRPRTCGGRSCRGRFCRGWSRCARHGPSCRRHGRREK